MAGIKLFCLSILSFFLFFFVFLIQSSLNYETWLWVLAMESRNIFLLEKNAVLDYLLSVELYTLFHLTFASVSTNIDMQERPES